MIQTDKYKKGIMALSKRAAELNPVLGEYKNHFINEQAKFIVMLSNGKLEIDINLAREFEQNPLQIKEGELKILAITYKTNHKTSMAVDTIWNRLFLDNKRSSSF